MSLLSLDIGNSAIKAFDHDKQQWRKLNDEGIPLQTGSQEIKHILYCSTRNKEQTESYLRKISHCFLQAKIQSAAQLIAQKNFKIHYSETLGEDRLIAAYGAGQLYPDQNLLCLDMGTYTTVDLIQENEFHGGYIIPGHQLYFQTYHHSPVLKAFISDQIPTKLNHHFPQNSASAMNESYWRLLESFVFERPQISTLVLTGGHSLKYQALFAQKCKALNWHFHHQIELIHQSMALLIK